MNILRNERLAIVKTEKINSLNGRTKFNPEKIFSAKFHIALTRESVAPVKN